MESIESNNGTYSKNSFEVLKDSPLNITEMMRDKVLVDRTSKEVVDGRAHQTQLLDHIINRIPACFDVLKELQRWNLNRRTTSNREMFVSVTIFDDSSKVNVALARCTNCTNNSTAKRNWITNDGIIEELVFGIGGWRPSNKDRINFGVSKGSTVCEDMLNTDVNNMREAPVGRSLVIGIEKILVKLT